MTMIRCYTPPYLSVCERAKLNSDLDVNYKGIVPVSPLKAHIKGKYRSTPGAEKLVML